MKNNPLVIPDWPAPEHIKALTTTREGGVSGEGWESWNLAAHVDDDPDAVTMNRNRLHTRCGVPESPKWLNQVHSSVVVVADEVTEPVDADASVTESSDTVCAVLTADCLPVLFTNKKGTCVAAAHAGWRGLADGVLENTIEKMPCQANELMAWLGPAIGPEAFEVGQDVFDAFCADESACEVAFTLTENGKYLADIYQLATLRLNKAGVEDIYGGGFCTVNDPRFFSYRQESVTGRMASLIWISGDQS